MGNKLFGAVVFLLWASSMAWLVSAKILPAYLLGQAPASGATDQSKAIGWEVDLGGDRCGYAVSQALAGGARVTEIHSRVVVDHISLDEIAPRWMLALVQDIGEIHLELRTKTTLDSFGNLAAIESWVTLNDLPAVVRVDGGVSDGKLKLRFRSGEMVRPVEYPWREGNLLGELAPESKLLAAYVGQRWRSEVYSPFGSPHAPVELIEARVVEEEEIVYRGRLTKTRRIEYRSAASAGVSSKNRLRAVLWVAEDGVVLRQDAYFLNTRLRFVRMSDDQATAMAGDYLELDKYATDRALERNQADHSPQVATPDATHP
jgi:hypothetical protein